MMQHTGTPTIARPNAMRRSATTLPFGTFEKRRNIRLQLIIFLILGFSVLAFGYIKYVRDPATSALSADPLINMACGEDGNPFGHIVGYLDGVAVYSNCNDNIASGAFALFRPNGALCATIEADGKMVYTSIGERLKERWETFNRRQKHVAKHEAAGGGGINGVGAPKKVSSPHDAEAALLDGGVAAHDAAVYKHKEEDGPIPPGVSQGITAHPIEGEDKYICGVQTGMLWQCVEFARRYWYVTQRCVFGSIEGAEDIFKLTTAEVLSDDADGGKKVIGYRHLESHPNHGPNPPMKGDALIWRRQKDMPYGHVGIIAGVEMLPEAAAGGANNNNRYRDPYDDERLELLKKDVETSFIRLATLKAEKDGHVGPLSSEAIAAAKNEAQQLLKTSAVVGIAHIADQNYHSKSWAGKSFHRHHVLLREELHVDTDRYLLLDPEGYVVLGWVRLGEKMAEPAKDNRMG